VYHAGYIGYLQATLKGAFVAVDPVTRIDSLAELLQPYAERAGSEQAFDAAVAQLKAFVAQRVTVVDAFLARRH